MNQEILINAIKVSKSNYPELYEFVLNEELEVVECIRVDSLAEGMVRPIDNHRKALKEVLFELNHVRVNPRTDNTMIIKKLTDALQQVGVCVANAPTQNDMAVCYKPLGEISDNVRFYFREDGRFIFLSPASRPHVLGTVSIKGPETTQNSQLRPRKK